MTLLMIGPSMEEDICRCRGGGGGGGAKIFQKCTSDLQFSLVLKKHVLVL